MMQRRAVLGVLLGLAGFFLAGCDDKSDEPTRVVATEKPHDLPAWLNVNDKMDPAVWLRSREVNHEVLPTDSEVERIRRAMQQASSRFFEDQRMIANRTAQTADMLAELHQPERTVDVMTAMIDVADSTPAKKLYGELCAHYINVRKGGKDRTAAIRQLSDAYSNRGNIR